MTDKKRNKEPTQVRIAWHCTCFNVRRASRAVTQFYDDILEPSGVKATHFTMLGAIALMGPASVTRIASHLALDRTTLTRNLRILIDQKFVELVSGTDRRERVVALTVDGQKTVEQATPLWHKAQAELATRFGEQRWKQMIEDMTELGSFSAGDDRREV